MYPTLARVHALAIGIMVHLASRPDAGAVGSDELRQRARLSTSYFDKIVADLRRHGLMRATRERGGGNVLGRAAMLISMRDIVAAMNAPLAGAARRRAPRPANGRPTARLSIELWDALETRQLEWLASVTLESMVQQWLRRESGAPAPVAAPAVPRDAGAASLVATTPNSVFALAAVLSRRGAAPMPDAGRTKRKLQADASARPDWSRPA